MKKKSFKKFKEIITFLNLCQAEPFKISPIYFL